jgi:hypothetical protein
MESWYASQTDDRAIKRRDSRFYSTIARLKRGVTLQQAEDELNRVTEALEREYPVENRGIRIKLTTLREFETGKFRPYLLLLRERYGVAASANARRLRAVEPGFEPENLLTIRVVKPIRLRTRGGRPDHRRHRRGAHPRSPRVRIDPIIALRSD